MKKHNFLFRTDEVTWNKLESYCTKKNITYNKFLNAILKDHFSDANKNEIKFNQFMPVGDEKKIEKKIKLTKSELEMIRAFAEQNGNRENEEILQRLIGTFSKKPVIAKNELKAIGISNHVLINIGTNINQISRNLNSGNYPGNLDQDLLVVINDLKYTIDVLRKSIHTLIEQSTGRWYFEKKGEVSIEHGINSET